MLNWFFGYNRKNIAFYVAADVKKGFERMIKHIVCFKLKDNSPEEVAKAASVLRSMEGNVPLLRGIEVGCDFLHSPRSYDIILQVWLDSALDLAAYQEDE